MALVKDVSSKLKALGDSDLATKRLCNSSSLRTLTICFLIIQVELIVTHTYLGRRSIIKNKNFASHSNDMTWVYKIILDHE